MNVLTKKVNLNESYFICPR